MKVDRYMHEIPPTAESEFKSLLRILKKPRTLIRNIVPVKCPSQED